MIIIQNEFSKVDFQLLLSNQYIGNQTNQTFPEQETCLREHT